MKEGTRYAARFKRAYAKLRQSAGEIQIPEPGDPIRCLAVAILGVECGEEEAARAVDRALTKMVDWNDLRVSSAEELHSLGGSTVPQGRLQCQRLIDALQAIYDRENRISLERLHSIGRREARQYLDSLEGVDEHAAASVVLWNLGGHAIPVSDPLLEWLREEDLVNPSATRAEVQAFLERHINATEAKETCIVLQSAAMAKRSTMRAATKTKPGGAAKTAGKKSANE